MMTEDANIMTISRYGFVPYIWILQPCPFPFRMLRCVTVIQNVDPFPVDYISLFDLLIKELGNARLQEQLWFLLLVGIEHETILPILK